MSTDQVLIFLLGAAVSAFGAVVGFGGGVFMVPLLIICFSYPFNMAVGSVMVSLLPASIISSLFNYRQRNIDYLIGTLIQAPTIIGTLVGALLVAAVPILALQLVFSAFVMSIGMVMLQKQGPARPTRLRRGTMVYKLKQLPPAFIRKNKPKHAAYQVSAGLVMVFGLIAGVLSGLFGIGGGFLSTPFMIRILKVPAKIAASTSLFTVLLTSIVGSISHYLLGHMQFMISLPVILGFTAGAVLGNLLDVSNKNNRLEKLIGIGLLLSGLGVLADLLFS